MRNFRNKQKGLTLVELMLVSVAIGMIFVMYIGYTAQQTRTQTIDRASQQMQQILNGALSYYLANGDWPASLAAMQPPASTIAYVPAGIMSPWNTAYVAQPVPPIAPSTRSALFYVQVQLPNALKGADAIGAVLAGKLPYGVSTSGAIPTVITSTVNLPGSNVNNATAINFAGVFHNGACVPVPSCPPSDGSGKPMVPEILVTPSSVSGNYDQANPTDVYPISSFTANVTAPTANPPGPPSCSPTGKTGCDAAATSSSGLYWRVCLQVITEKGQVAWDDTTAQYAVVTAMTRCAVQGEAAGDPFSVFGP